MTNDIYDAWREAALSGTYTPLSEQRIREAFSWTSKHGPPNCWTGTTGHAATLIRELLREREQLLEAIASKEECNERSV